jgi:hypothetical protein
MDFERRNVDERSDNRRGAEDPTLLIGRAVIEAISISPVMASVRELFVGIARSVESQLMRLRDLDRQILEAAEFLAAIDAFQRGEKDQLRRWVAEHYGVKLDTVLGAKLRRNIPKIVDNPDADAGAVLVLARRWIDGCKKQQERRTGRSAVIKRNTEVRRGIKGNFPSVEYALSMLARRGETENDVLRNEIPGESYVQAAELPRGGNLAGRTASGIRRWIERSDRPGLVSSTGATPDDALRHVDDLELATFAMRELLERCAHDAGLSHQESEAFFFGELFGNTEAAVILNRPARQIGVEKFRARQKLRATVGL